MRVARHILAIHVPGQKWGTYSFSGSSQKVKNIKMDPNDIKQYKEQRVHGLSHPVLNAAYA